MLQSSLVIPALSETGSNRAFVVFEDAAASRHH